MKQLLLILLTGALIATGLSAQSGERMAQLQQDLQTARVNASLTPEQNQKLDDALAKLRDAAAVKKDGGTVDREQVKAAMMSIRDVAQNFTDEDKKKIRDHMMAMREGKQRGRRRN
jgi:formate dehydrogenase assembly factor FdhD